MATQKIGYGTEQTLTYTSLNSLASSASLVAGAESTAIDNTTTLAPDYLIGGTIKVGASNMTANTTCEVWVAGEHEDTPTYPDVFDGTDSAETVTSRNVLYAGAMLAHVITFDGTDANRVYPVKQFSVASLFGGNVPRHFVLFTVHNGGNALAASGSAFYAMPILPTVA